MERTIAGHLVGHVNQALDILRDREALPEGDRRTGRQDGRTVGGGRPAGVQRVPAATSETQKGSLGGSVPLTAAGLPSVSNCEFTTNSLWR